MINANNMHSSANEASTSRVKNLLKDESGAAQILLLLPFISKILERRNSKYSYLANEYGPQAAEIAYQLMQNKKSQRRAKKMGAIMLSAMVALPLTGLTGYAVAKDKAFGESMNLNMEDTEGEVTFQKVSKLVFTEGDAFVSNVTTTVQEVWLGQEVPLTTKTLKLLLANNLVSIYVDGEIKKEFNHTDKTITYTITPKQIASLVTNISRNYDEHTDFLAGAAGFLSGVFDSVEDSKALSSLKEDNEELANKFENILSSSKDDFSKLREVIEFYSTFFTSQQCGLENWDEIHDLGVSSLEESFKSQISGTSEGDYRVIVLLPTEQEMKNEHEYLPNQYEENPNDASGFLTEALASENINVSIPDEFGNCEYINPNDTEEDPNGN